MHRSNRLARGTYVIIPSKGWNGWIRDYVGGTIYNKNPRYLVELSSGGRNVWIDVSEVKVYGS
ncbi:MAG TPA: hypothetical protein VHK27_06105 [Gammaproteobacteria bacterium]|nr:hypothetical protein [Gammaproteobacteria bacterium]